MPVFILGVLFKVLHIELPSFNIKISLELYFMKATNTLAYWSKRFMTSICNFTFCLATYKKLIEFKFETFSNTAAYFSA